MDILLCHSPAQIFLWCPYMYRIKPNSFTHTTGDLAMWCPLLTFQHSLPLDITAILLLLDMLWKHYGLSPPSAFHVVSTQKTLLFPVPYVVHHQANTKSSFKFQLKYWHSSNFSSNTDIAKKLSWKFPGIPFPVQQHLNKSPFEQLSQDILTASLLLLHPDSELLEGKVRHYTVINPSVQQSARPGDRAFVEGMSEHKGGSHL